MTTGWLSRLSVLACLVLAAACASGPASQSSMIAQKLAGGVYKGEWKPGYLYQVTFLAGGTIGAQVRVMDDDFARTVRDMPARVVILGNIVELRFVQGDRADRLVYNAEEDELGGQSVYHGAAQDRLRARRMGAADTRAADNGASLVALFPEFTWVQQSSAIFLGRDANGVIGAICANSGDGSQEALFTTCGAALARQVGQAPSSADSLSWAGYSTFKAIGPNSGDLVVVVGRDNAAIMDESVKMYKMLAPRPSW